MLHKIQQFYWDIDFLKSNSLIKSNDFGIPQKVREINYPLRLARYWFMLHLLKKESQSLGPIDVCEIGVDYGQMKLFLNAASSKNKVLINKWDAVDVKIQKKHLFKIGYDNFYEIDLENDKFSLSRKKYDVIIVLHLLEHLFDPEKLMKKISKNLKFNGVIIGGFPCLPDFLRQPRENKIRPIAKKYGHVSVFSKKRVIDIALKNNLTLEFYSGAYFMRKKGFFLENFKWWFKFNILFGALFPSWIGESYWLMRKKSQE